MNPLFQALTYQFSPAGADAHAANSSSPKGKRSTATALAFLMVTCGLALSSKEAIAQTTSSAPITRDAASGALQVDNNAFDIQTGALENTSNIPIPTQLPAHTREGEAQPTNREILAPNTIEISPDVDYIDQAVNAAARNEGKTGDYQVKLDALQFTTEFEIIQSPGNHRFGQGIEVTVSDENGPTFSSESTFVRGGGIRIGPDSEALPESGQISVSYGANETVELRVLNLRADGADPEESGIYLSEEGEFVVEDAQRGGDRDFNDGEYTQVSSGRGEAEALSQDENRTVRTRVRERELDPEVRTEEIVAEAIVENIVSADNAAVEERDFGEVETASTQPTAQVLGHATGATTATGQQLTYSRYAGNSQIRAGSDGVGMTGQLKPLINNPNAAPTLLTGNLTFNPFLGDNTAGLTGSIGVNQFLNRTHRLATDAAGNVIEDPSGSGAPLVEPAGLLSNRRLVGYVPSEPANTVAGGKLGEQLFPTNGIFEIPENQAIVISPADSQTVGRGNAAYTNNVGGILIEANDGSLDFVPQWTQAGYAQSPITLEAGEATKVIYALVPQQAGQALTLGENYPVQEGANGYEIAAGGFSIISADKQPQNFVAETATVYAVEDTLPGNNAITELFNGIRGVYAEETGGERMPTVDVTVADEVDARVGNQLFPVNTVAVLPGQAAYARTTRAAGLYLSGSLTGGIGNQRDTVRQLDVEMDSVTSEFLTQRTVNTFITPITQRDTITRERIATTQTSSTAFFDIDNAGELTNVNFVDGEREVIDVSNTVIDRKREIIKGEEMLVSADTEETIELLSTEMVESDRTTEGHNSDSYANFSAVQGELALGGVLNFGNTPWTSAANTVRAELFAQETVFGRSDDGIETGWRAEAIFHPFGEVQKEAYQFDSAGNVVPVFRTQPVLDASGQQILETLTDTSGELVEVGVNEFVTDEAGDRIAQTVGTGEAKGPGIYLRAQDTFSDGEGVVIAGGFQLSF